MNLLNKKGEFIVLAGVAVYNFLSWVKNYGFDKIICFICFLFGRESFKKYCELKGKQEGILVVLLFYFKTVNSYYIFTFVNNS